MCTLAAYFIKLCTFFSSCSSFRPSFSPSFLPSFVSLATLWQATTHILNYTQPPRLPPSSSMGQFGSPPYTLTLNELTHAEMDTVQTKGPMKQLGQFIGSKLCDCSYLALDIWSSTLCVCSCFVRPAKRPHLNTIASLRGIRWNLCPKTKTKPYWKSNLLFSLLQVSLITIQIDPCSKAKELDASSLRLSPTD